MEYILNIGLGVFTIRVPITINLVGEFLPKEQYEHLLKETLTKIAQSYGGELLDYYRPPAKGK